MSLAHLTVPELFSLYAELMEEFQKRGIVRSLNNPIADYAELLAAQTLGAEIQPASNSHFDLLKQDGTRYQVKARRPTAANPSRQLGFIRDLTERHFDYLVGILFNEDYTVQKAALIPWDIVSAYSRYRQREKVWILHLDDHLWELETVENLLIKPLKGTFKGLRNKKSDTLTRLCLCGCGESPKSRRSNFVMGHDAKLKSQILKDPDNVSEVALQYAENNWPELFSEPIDPVPKSDGRYKQLIAYLVENAELLDTKPSKLCHIPSLGQSFCGWKASRLKIFQDGIEQLKSPDDNLVVQIQPKSNGSNYQEGFFICSLRELQELQSFQKAVKAPCYTKLGYYTWPTLTKEMKEHFYPL
jgi:hypothetical protein